MIGDVTMPEKKNIFSTLFGDTPEAQAVAAAREQESLKFQDMLNTQKQALEQRRTDDRRLATFNALGNVLTSMVQPLGWGKAGATAPVAPVDNRQYLESFSRLMKDNDDLRNLATLEKDYGFRLAQRDTALGEQAVKRAEDARVQEEYARQRHQYTMDEIAARGDNQKEVAEIRGKYRVTKNGKTQTEQDLKTAHTAWVNYLKQFWTDSGRNVTRAEGDAPLTFEQFLGKEGYVMQKVSPSDSTATPAPKNEKKGGFKFSAKEKKGGFITQ